MQQHPIPQNVTQYQFRLVGNMTLKQFLELAGGLLIAYLIYLSNLPIIIKLPLALLSALIGIGMAFFPVEERPLDQWLINFIKAIYSPTLYYWKKEPTLPDFFSYQPPSPTPQPSPPTTKPHPSNSPTPPTTKTEPEIQSPLFQKINQLLDKLPPISPTSAPSPTPSITKPSIRIRRLKPQTNTSPPPPQKATTTFQTPPSSPNSPPIPTPPTPKPSSPQIIFQKSTPTKEKLTQPTQTETIDIAPLTPTKPNLVAGVVTDQNHKLLPNVIVEITDTQGIPQRAIKTNALGQFSIATPLSPGTYFVKVDDESLNIPPQKIEVNNQIIPPIHLHPKPETSSQQLVTSDQ